jgi:hypothetical protein
MQGQRMETKRICENCTGWVRTDGERGSCQKYPLTAGPTNSGLLHWYPPKQSWETCDGWVEKVRDGH